MTKNGFRFDKLQSKNQNFDLKFDEGWEKCFKNTAGDEHELTDEESSLKRNHNFF